MSNSFVQNRFLRACPIPTECVKLAAVLAMCCALSACAGVTGGGSAGTSGSPSGGGQPAVSLSVTTLTFGNQTVGSKSASQTVTLTNVGVAALSKIAISTSSNFSETNTCGTSLNVGAGCTISVTFAPGTTGVLTGSLRITDNASGSPQLVSLTGTGTGSSGGKQPAVSLSVTLLTFANQTIGTNSAAQTVTLTNVGSAALAGIAISTSGNFSETNTCGTSLNVGAKCNINVAFTPATAGVLAGSLSIADNASGSPQSVSLTGTGISSSGGGGGGGGGVGTGCAGTPITQVQTNVTSQLSYVNTAAGVSVTQLTDSGTNRFYYFDIPAYSAAVNEIFYVDFVAGNGMVTSNTGGAGTQIVSPALTGSQGFLSPDGTLAYYDGKGVGGTLGGRDIFGIFLNKTGICQQLQLTNLDVPPQSPLPVWEISGSSPDPAGGQDIAFSPDTVLHRVHVLTNGTSQALSIITLNDPENGTTFHRIRLNPKFPNIVMYKRNVLGGTTAQPEAWIVDLNTCANNACSASQIINVVANLKGPAGLQALAGHINWSPDGLDILFSEPDIADYWIARNVVNSSGTINNAFTLQELGPFVKPEITADYCVFPPDWPNSTVLACLAGPASASNPKTLYLMSSDGKGTIKLLADTDALVLTIDGTPMPQFVQDDQHLMFNSDRTGIPQIYLISGFTLTVP